ncbi:CYIR protein, partial [Plasmodium cynomolgi strain B]
ITSTICVIKEEGKLLQLCQRIENIFNQWENIISSRTDIQNKCCDYFIYWLYGKLVEYNFNSWDIFSVYDKFSSFIINKCFKENNNEFHIKKVYDLKALRNKKELFDFVEYYKNLKDIWNDGIIDNNKNYCEYAKYVLELFKEMEKKKCSSIYKYEIEHFAKEIINNQEIQFILNKCPDIKIDRELYKQYKIQCTKENVPDNGSLKSSSEPNSANARAHTATVPGNNSAEVVAAEKLVKEMNNNVDVLKQLSSYQIFIELNNDDDINNYDSYCKNIDSTGSNTLDVKKLCQKIVRNLRIMYKILEKEKRNECCLYFNYWLHDQIKSIFGANLEKSNYKNHALKLLELQFRINNELRRHDCYYNFNDKLDEWEEIMHLLYYFKNYKTIASNAPSDQGKHEQYCKYFTKIKELFEKHINDCCACFINPSKYCLNYCPKYFKCEEEYYPINLIVKLGCAGEIPTESAETLFKSVTVDYKAYLLSNKSNNPKKSKSIESSKTIEPNEKYTSPKDIFHEIMSDPFNLFGMGGLSFVGISLLFFVLYKFTPMGLWLNKKSVRQQKFNQSVHNKNMQPALVYNSEPQNMNPRNERIRIAYQAE